MCFVKVNNRNTTKRCEICSVLTIKTLEQLQRYGAFIINFERISLLSLMFLLLTMNINLYWVVNFWINICSVHFAIPQKWL